MIDDDLPDVELVACMAAGLYERRDGRHWLNLEAAIDAYGIQEPTAENDETVAWLRAALAIAQEWSE